MIIVPLFVAWVVVPPVLGYLIGRWWALAFSLTGFPAFLLWRWLTPPTPFEGEPVLGWFGALLGYGFLFLFLTLPPLGLSAVTIAWRKWA